MLHDQVRKEIRDQVIITEYVGGYSEMKFSFQHLRMTGIREPPGKPACHLAILLTMTGVVFLPVQVPWKTLEMKPDPSSSQDQSVTTVKKRIFYLHPGQPVVY